MVRAWGFVGVGRSPVDQGALFAALPAAETAVARARGRELDSAPPGSAALLRTATTWWELADLTRLLAAPGGGEQLAELTTARWASAREELRSRTAGLTQAAAPALADFDSTVLGVDLEPVRQALRIAQASFFLGRKGRLVAGAAPVWPTSGPAGPYRRRSCPPGSTSSPRWPPSIEP